MAPTVRIHGKEYHIEWYHPEVFAMYQEISYTIWYSSILHLSEYCKKLPSIEGSIWNTWDCLLVCLPMLVQNYSFPSELDLLSIYPINLKLVHTTCWMLVYRSFVLAYYFNFDNICYDANRGNNRLSFNFLLKLKEIVQPMSLPFFVHILGFTQPI